MTKRNTATVPALDSVEALRQTVAEARERIAALGVEARETEKPNAAELRQQIANRVNASQAELVERLRLSLIRAAAGVRIEGLLDARGPDAASSLLALVLGPDVLVSALSRLLPEETEDRPDAAQRAARRAEIEREMFDAECREERAIRALQEQGVHAPRRADADPRAVLAD